MDGGMGQIFRICGAGRADAEFWRDRRPGQALCGRLDHETLERRVHTAAARMRRQDNDSPGLFGEVDPSPATSSSSLPQGFRYQRELVTPHHERDLLRHIEPLAFREFEFHGFSGKRRVVSFGWRYDYGERDCKRRKTCRGFYSRCASAPRRSPDSGRTRCNMRW